jgi:radical SAM protein with 4Fe4S-binding SPASM domain
MKLRISEPLDFPSHLDLELTNVCQLHCAMCPHDKMQRKQGFMLYSTLDKVCQEAEGKAKTCYLHQFGDPLLHPQLARFIERCKKTKLWVSTSTNAMALTSDKAKEIYEAGLDHLVISLDALHETTYNKLRIGGDFKRVRENVMAAAMMLIHNANYKTKLEIQMVVMNENKDEALDFYAFWNEIIAGWEVGSVSLKPHITWANNVEQRSPWKATLPFQCTMLNYSMSVYWNGDVVMCCHDYDGFTKVGNVNKSTLKSLWDSDAYKTMRQAHKERAIEKLQYCAGCYQTL